MPRILIALSLCPLFLFHFFIGKAFAHYSGQSFTTLSVNNTAITGQTDICLNDLSLDLPLDTDGNGDISLPEVQAQQDKIATYFNNNISLQLDAESVVLKPVSFKLVDFGQCRYLQTHWEINHATIRPHSIKIKINILLDKKPQFINFVALNEGKEVRSAVLTSSNPRSELFLDKGQEFLAFIRYGIFHIGTGIDHLFFLILLIFNVFMASGNDRQKKEKNFPALLFDITKLATAFTVAHSSTLCLSVLDIYSMPQQVVETVVILSIIFVGLNDIFNFYTGREWLLIFIFGLFHGLGFADGLKNLGLSGGNLAVPLFGFNLGIEIGQIILIACLLPTLYILSRRWKPLLQLLIGLCWTIVSISVFWLLERFSSYIFH